MSFKPNMNFLKNNFQIRSDTKIYDPKNSSATGLVREKLKQINNRNAFVDANILVGDFITQVFPDAIPPGCSFLFDDFLAAAKMSKGLDVSSPDFKPFFAIVNIPEITFIPTPTSEKKDKVYNRKIREIVTILGVFKLYNFYGQFAVPNYGDPVHVTFKDMDTFSDPIFIAPLKTGQVSFVSGEDSSLDSECGKKAKLKTRIVGGREPPPSIVTSEKVNQFITTLEQVDIQTGTSAYGTSNARLDTPPAQNIKYAILIPKNTDRNQPVNVFLYFHGNDGSGGMDKLLTEGPSHIPDGHNIVLIRPVLATKPGNGDGDKISVIPGFCSDALLNNGFANPEIASITTFSHSGGGAPHGWYLYHLAKGNLFNGNIGASRFLDSDYGFSSLRKLFTSGVNSNFESARITFVVSSKEKKKPWKFATGKLNTNGQYDKVYKNTGVRVIESKTNHMPLASQIGPEYLIPNVEGATPPGSDGGPNGQAQQSAAQKAQEEQKLNAANSGTSTDAAQKAAEANAGTAQSAAEEEKAKKAAAAAAAGNKKVNTNTSPKKPSDKKTNKTTPKTKGGASQAKKPNQDLCAKNTNLLEDLEWTDMGGKRNSSIAPRVHRMGSSHGYGIKSMKQFLIGLSTVKGGEDNNSGFQPYSLQYPPDAKPGWYFQDISRKPGGDTKAHKSHESGINIDLSLPMKIAGKRGMSIQKRTSGGISFCNVKKMEDYDEDALMSFFLYAIPKCNQVLMDDLALALFAKLVPEWAKSGKGGWSLTHPAYVQARVSLNSAPTTKQYANKANGWANRRPPGVTKEMARGKACDLMHYARHDNHFHVRLRTAGTAPGPFDYDGYTADQKPGADIKGGRGRDKGDGKLDPGPGETIQGRK